MQTSFLDEPGRGQYPLDGATPGRCKSCNAPIAWHQTTNGVAIPLDVEHATNYQGRRFAPTHFAYCPHGPHWRRKQ